jgi:hypothetical protein
MVREVEFHENVDIVDCGVVKPRPESSSGGGGGGGVRSRGATDAVFWSPTTAPAQGGSSAGMTR